MKLSVRSPQFRCRGDGQRDIAVVDSDLPAVYIFRRIFVR